MGKERDTSGTSRTRLKPRLHSLALVVPLGDGTARDPLSVDDLKRTNGLGPPLLVLGSVEDLQRKASSGGARVSERQMDVQGRSR